MATHHGFMELAGAQVECAVLPDETRLITAEGLLRALGCSELPAAPSPHAVDPRLEALRPLLAPGDTRALDPIHFRIANQGASNGQRFVGLKADAVPAICTAILNARRQEVVNPALADLAHRSETLLSGLGVVGIVALVDEATGYQKYRASRALEQILRDYVSPRLSSWTKRFPLTFYEQIYRLKGWACDAESLKRRPGCVAGWTRKYIYSRLPPGVIDGLDRANPITKPGRRKHAHHQWLTCEIGHPALEKHLFAVEVLMKAATSWQAFVRMIDNALPAHHLPPDLFPDLKFDGELDDEKDV